MLSYRFSFNFCRLIHYDGGQLYMCIFANFFIQIVAKTLICLFAFLLINFCGDDLHYFNRFNAFLVIIRLYLPFSCSFILILLTPNPLSPNCISARLRHPFFVVVFLPFYLTCVHQHLFFSFLSSFTFFFDGHHWQTQSSVD